MFDFGSLASIFALVDSDDTSSIFENIGERVEEGKMIFSVFAAD